ncbi:hypothetical protein ACFL3H_09595 [Gemmatimonadota bacterium]
MSRHKTSAHEVATLLDLIQRDLSDCRVDSIGTDWAFNIAYNAALQAATLALHVSGFRASREGGHERTIESLRYTINADPDLIRLLQDFRKKRNKAEYEMSGVVSELEREEMLRTAEDLFIQIQKWLKEHHPDLVK